MDTQTPRGDFVTFTQGGTRRVGLLLGAQTDPFTGERSLTVLVGQTMTLIPADTATVVETD